MEEKYYMTLNGVTLLVNAEQAKHWIEFVVWLGKLPVIDKVEKAA